MKHTNSAFSFLTGSPNTTLIKLAKLNKSNLLYNCHIYLKITRNFTKNKILIRNTFLHFYIYIGKLFVYLFLPR